MDALAHCDYARQRLSATLFLSLSLSLFSDLALFSHLSLSKNDVCCFVLASSRARTRTALLSVSLTSPALIVFF